MGKEEKKIPLTKRFFTKKFEVKGKKNIGSIYTYQDINTIHYDIKVPDKNGKIIYSYEGDGPDFWTNSSITSAMKNYARNYKTIDGTIVKEANVFMIIDRIASGLRVTGIKSGYFNKEESWIYYDETRYMMIHQYYCQNTPVMINAGMFEAYNDLGQETKNQMFYYDPKSKKVVSASHNYDRAQTSACFITGVKDSLHEEGGIYDGYVNDSKLFKYGSGVGTNMSSLRGEGEPLSMGGYSSGSISYAKTKDRNGQMIKSGGYSRRSAIMQQWNYNHPDTAKVLNLKTNEENKVLDLISGSTLLNKIYDKAVRKNPSIRFEAYEEIRKRFQIASKKTPVMFINNVKLYKELIDNYLNPIIKEFEKLPVIIKNRMITAIQGSFEYVLGCEFDHSITHEYFIELLCKYNPFKRLNSDFYGEAYETVAFQSSNISIRVSDEFMKNAQHRYHNNGYEINSSFEVRNISNGKLIENRDYMETLYGIAKASYDCGDPALFFHDTVNRFNTCSNSFEIEASNPCAEYNFANETSCNLASINLLKFVKINPTDTEFKFENHFNMKEFEYVVKHATLALDITIDMGKFPSKEVAYNTYMYRTLGLGYANLGSLLIKFCSAYGDTVSCLITDFITKLMKFYSMEKSSEIAEKLGAFEMYKENVEPYINVLNLQNGKPSTSLEFHVVPSDTYFTEDDNDNFYENNFTTAISKRVGKFKNKIAIDIQKEYNKVTKKWDKFTQGMESGSTLMRNAQLTCIAPTGTISFFMDSTTQGIEPPLSTKVTKKVVDGSYITIYNDAVNGALEYMFHDQPDVLEELLNGKKQIEDVIDMNKASDLKLLDIFKTSLGNGNPDSTISPRDHMKIMAAAQRTVCGAISKTVNLQTDATVNDMVYYYIFAWELGLKCVTFFRNNSKLDQPLNSAQEDAQIEEEKWDNLFNILEDDRMGTVAVSNTDLISVPDDLPARRFRFKLNGESIYINVSELNGIPCEVFIQGFKKGSVNNKTLDLIGRSLSFALRSGKDLDTIIEFYGSEISEPRGIVQGCSSKITSCTSLINLVTQVLDVYYNDEESKVYVTGDQPNSLWVHPSVSWLGKFGTWRGELDDKGDETPSVVNFSQSDIRDNSLVGVKKEKTTTHECQSCGHIMETTGSGCGQCPNCLTSYGGCS